MIDATTLEVDAEATGASAAPGPWPDGLPDRHRHRRDVHRPDPRRPDGRVELFKTPSTPDHPPEAIRERARARSPSALGIAVREFLADCDLIIHGTTVALNALIQLSGAKVGLFCTRGHEDSLEIRNGHKEDGHRYDFRVPGRRRCSCRGGCASRSPSACLSDGRVRTPLDEDDVRRGDRDLPRARGSRRSASRFLWSFLHPEHERRVGELVAEELPEVHLTLSSRTAASDPRVHAHEHRRRQRVRRPEARRYIGSIETMLRGARVLEPDPLRPVERRSDVGARARAGAPSARSTPVPRQARARASTSPRASAGSNVLTLDVGGTSTDISLVQDGRVDLVKDIDIGRYRVGIPLVNVISIGAGGGSIAWLDAQGLLRVGPQSAEAVPGPACYMRGGIEATVTDALVVLGYLNQDGAARRADADRRERRAATRSPTASRRRSDSALERAALGIYDVINANMIGGIRSVSVERGHDPRDFWLVAGGGATSAHAGRLAAELGRSRRS